MTHWRSRSRRKSSLWPAAVAQVPGGYGRLRENALHVQSAWSGLVGRASAQLGHTINRCCPTGISFGRRPEGRPTIKQPLRIGSSCLSNCEAAVQRAWWLNGRSLACCSPKPPIWSTAAMAEERSYNFLLSKEVILTIFRQKFRTSFDTSENCHSPRTYPHFQSASPS